MRSNKKIRSTSRRRKSNIKKTKRSIKTSSAKKNSNKKNEVVEVRITGWRDEVQTKNLIKIVKREYKKGTKKIIALDQIDYQQHAKYDVNELMKKINNKDTKNLLKCYNKWYKFW